MAGKASSPATLLSAQRMGCVCWMQRALFLASARRDAGSRGTKVVSGGGSTAHSDRSPELSPAAASRSRFWKVLQWRERDPFSRTQHHSVLLSQNPLGETLVPGKVHDLCIRWPGPQTFSGSGLKCDVRQLLNFHSCSVKWHKKKHSFPHFIVFFFKKRTALENFWLLQ